MSRELTAMELSEIVRRVLARVKPPTSGEPGPGGGGFGEAGPVGPGRAADWLQALPPELRGISAGRWDEPPEEGYGVVGPTQGPSAGRCLGCAVPGLCAWTCAATTSRLLIEGADRVGATLGGRSADPEIADRIDHTLLKADATAEAVDRLCDEAARYGFATVCINPHWVRRAASRLRGRGVPVCAVVGFPLGATFPEVKAAEAALAVEEGASEIDMVMQIGVLKSKDYRFVSADIRGVVEAAGVPVKVILETALLTREEKVTACALAKSAGAAFVKTSTGFGPSGATIDDVRLMRQTVGETRRVKAAGGIRDLDFAQSLVEAGADRIGASASVKIVRGE